ncbi:helix-turn-helix transcriptional regulator [Evansella sp. LMS18]|uniref:substrate-binding domain-containing protein n=1 Tax=Evansella sp. LMS18 TaxID=2924033 RepID=UPI0020D0749A|nr:helix-turn-helix transcriptional regulator [Evansella sp. LMS18]UTR09187.1 helix-turn-helix transcriptional regulator [Evansella sp. LMS18]
MTEKIYTPDEIAQLLQISKHTVYELIKREELIAFKIGNKMRIEEKEVEAFKRKNSTKTTSGKPIGDASVKKHFSVRLAGSHDILLDKFCQSVHQDSGIPVTLQTSFIGSLEGLMALYRDECDIAAVHLFDENTSQYNIPVINQFFSSAPVSVVHFTTRRQGFILPKGNPKNITGWESLLSGDIRIVNRQRGSGTRQLLDSSLRKINLSPSSIKGYETEETTHYGAASMVVNGTADVTIGIEPVARLLGLDFIPLVEESFDLIFKWTEENKQALNYVLEHLQSDNAFKGIAVPVGYEVTDAGKIIQSPAAEMI